MFDSIVEALLREMLLACPPDRDYGLADLKGDLLPETVTRYAADLLRSAAASELDTYQPRDLNWVVQNEETQSIYGRFVAASISNAVVPAPEWEELLGTAVRRAVDHVLQPRTGLVTTVFPDDSGEKLDHDTIAERIGGYHTALPFRAAVVRALKKAPRSQLDAAGFRSIVDRVHDALTLDYTRADWQRDLEPLRSILELADLPDELSADDAAHLVEELGNADAASTLRATSTASVSLDDLIDVVAGPEPEDLEAEEAEAAASALAAEEAAMPETTDPVPLWQRFQRNLNEPIGSSIPPASPQAAGEQQEDSGHGTVAAPPERPRREPVVVEDEESQRPLWQKYTSSRTPEGSESTASDIEMFILGRDGARIRDSFVVELFGGDYDSYMTVLDQLKRSRSWSEASHVIAENVFKRFQINIYSEEAVAFTNAVEARFRVQESGD